MARWRLTAPHYLVVPGTYYEHKEVDRETGRQATKRFDVPRLVNPSDPSDCNRDGDCIVAHAGSEEGRYDIVFEGSPTPEMEPLDAEAEKLTAEFQLKWQHPVDSLPANGGADAGTFMQELKAIMAGLQPSTPLPQGPSAEEYEALKARLAALEAAAPPAKADRRSV